VTAANSFVTHRYIRRVASSGRTENGGNSRIDTSVAHSARVHDYWLGGKDNFAVDRAVGDAVMAAYPGIVQSVRAKSTMWGGVARR
jgi:S-adenosyl methyltransferase